MIPLRTADPGGRPYYSIASFSDCIYISHCYFVDPPCTLTKSHLTTRLAQMHQFLLRYYQWPLIRVLQPCPTISMHASQFSAVIKQQSLSTRFPCLYCIFKKWTEVCLLTRGFINFSHRTFTATLSHRCHNCFHAKAPWHPRYENLSTHNFPERAFRDYLYLTQHPETKPNRSLILRIDLPITSFIDHLDTTVGYGRIPNSTRLYKLASGDLTATNSLHSVRYSIDGKYSVE